MKVTDVFFHVEALKDWSGTHHVLTYVEERMNVGNAFNKLKGIFTAPVNGFYSFFFSSIKGNISLELKVYPRVNRVQVTPFYRPKDLLNLPIALHFTLKLSAGDQLDIMLEYGYFKLDYTYFTGWLQQEEMNPILLTNNETIASKLE